jgi:hypothetical protein
MTSRYLPRIDGLSQGGGGPPPSVDDHFAPTVIVGNVPAGDPAVAQGAPFQYVADPGDGSGIAAALAAIPVTGGWVHIRRGTYTVAPGFLPLPIGGNTRVTGDGVGTNLVANALDRRLFLMSSFNAQLADLRVTLPDAVQGASGTVLIDASGALRVLIENVEVRSVDEVSDNPNESLVSIFEVGVQARVLRATRAFDINTNSGAVAIVRVVGAEASVQAGNFIGADDGIVISDGGGGIVLGNTLSTQAIDAIRVEVGSTDTLVISNLLGGGTFTQLGGAEAAHNV